MVSTSVLKAAPGKLDIKKHSPSILYLLLLLSAWVCVGSLFYYVGLSVPCSFTTNHLADEKRVGLNVLNKAISIINFAKPFLNFIADTMI